MQDLYLNKYFGSNDYNVVIDDVVVIWEKAERDIL